MKDKCEYYHIHKWSEPSLEPDENGTLYTDNQCLKMSENSECFCEGDLDFCDIDAPNYDDDDFFQPHLGE